MISVPRVVWVLAVGRFLSSATSFLVLFLTLYLTGPRALPIGTAGPISGLFGLGLLLGNFTGGRFGDRWGHRPTLLVASMVTGLLLLAVVLDAAPEHLLGHQGLYTGAATSGTLLAGPLGAGLYALAPALLWPVSGLTALVAAALVLLSARANVESARRTTSWT